MSIVAIILILAVVVAVAVRFLVKMESEALRKIRDVFVIFTAVAVLWGAWEAHSSNNRVEKLSASNNDLLQASRARGLEVRRLARRIEEQTSPEAQLRQQQAINSILTRIDCNTRQAFTEAIQALVQLGIPEAASVSIVTAQCREVNATATSSTTTTAPGD